ncbi:efflux RND transporter permease subunit [Siccirubricoccus deserti]
MPDFPILVGAPSRNEGFAFLVLALWDARQRNMKFVSRSIKSTLDGIAGARPSVIAPTHLAGGQAPVQFVVRTTGKCNQLSQVTDDFVRRAQQDPGLARPLSDLSLAVPRGDVQIDKALAAKLKIPLSVIGEALAKILRRCNVSCFSWSGGFYRVVLELEAPARNSCSAPDEVPVRANVQLTATLPEVSAPHPQAVSSDGLVAAPGE